MNILARFRVFALFLLPIFLTAVISLVGGCASNASEIAKEWDPIPETKRVSLVQAYEICRHEALMYWPLARMGPCMAVAGWKPSCIQGDNCGGRWAVPPQAAGTALHVAAFNNNEKAAAVLIGEGVHIDGKNQYGWTPLQSAIFNDSEEAAKLLIKYGADVRATDENGITSLHMSAQHNSRKMAGLLLSKGANTEAEERDSGFTPLHRAAFHGSVDVADLLISRGARINAETYSGDTPLDIAERENQHDVVALLKRAARPTAQKTETADGENSAESVFENAWRSVVVVVAGGKQGGGAVINEPNRVATNCHVVDESPNDIRVYKGENRRAVRDAPHSAEIVSSDRERDVCILSVSGLWGIPAKIRSAAELEIGEAVYAVGAPKGLDFSISNGIVSQLREEVGETAPLIQTDAAISPGSSGGGLFDSRGRLVGLTTWKIREGENLNFAVPVDWALELSR